MQGEVRFGVHLTPRGGTDRVEGVVDGALRVRVAASPQEGAANRALIRLIARELNLPMTAVRIVGGAAIRRKMVSLAGVEPAVIDARWPGLAL